MVFRGYICTIYYLDDLIIHTRREGTTTRGDEREAYQTIILFILDQTTLLYFIVIIYARQLTNINEDDQYITRLITIGYTPPLFFLFSLFSCISFSLLFLIECVSVLYNPRNINNVRTLHHQLVCGMGWGGVGWGGDLSFFHFIFCLHHHILV